MTLGAMSAAGVSQALSSAWYGPEGDLISNDELKAFVDQSEGCNGGGFFERGRPVVTP